MIHSKRITPLSTQFIHHTRPVHSQRGCLHPCDQEVIEHIPGNVLVTIVRELIYQAVTVCRVICEGTGRVIDIQHLIRRRIPRLRHPLPGAVDHRLVVVIRPSARSIHAAEAVLGLGSAQGVQVQVMHILIKLSEICI